MHPALWFSFAPLAVAFLFAFIKMFLDGGLFSRLQFEDAAERIDVLARDGLEDYALSFLNEIDSRAGLDPKAPSNSRGDHHLAFRSDVSGVHVAFVHQRKLCHKF